MLSPPEYAPALSLDDSDLLLANTRHSSSSGSSGNNYDTSMSVGDPDYDLYNDDRDGDLIAVLYNAMFDVLLVVYERGAVHVFEPKVCEVMIGV